MDFTNEDPVPELSTAGTASTPGQPELTTLALHSLIDYVPMDKPAHLNQSDVMSDRFRSVFYMHNVDEVDVMQISQLISYYLRARFDVRFNRSPETDGERAGFMLFYSLKDFNAYFDCLRTFILRIYRQNQQLADRFERFVEEAKERETADGASPVTEETLNILRQFKEVRRVFSEFFEVFSSDRFDPGQLYERLFLERTVSAIIPLSIDIASVDSLDKLFDKLCLFTIQGVDFCNSIMPAVVSSGLVVYSLLYLCGSDALSDSRTPLAWAKINSEAEGMPQWLLAQTESPQYKREIAALPPSLFDASKGDVYVNKHDFIATLLAQTLNRLFTRMIEWPAREDVSKWMEDYLKCDNINRFFMENGRNEQLWIRFRKRKRDAPNDLPGVYVKVDTLNGMFDEIALSTKKTGGNAGSGGGDETSGLGNLLVGKNAGGGSVQLPSEKMSVRDRFEQFSSFRNKYVDFLRNGFAGDKNQPQRDMFDLVRRQFILATGGYRGFEVLKHAQETGHAFSLDEDLQVTAQGVVYRGCAHCTALLVPGSEPEIFHADRWIEQINNMVFPYNFVMLTSTSVNGYTRELLRTCVVFKMLEGLAKKRLTSERAEKLLDFFEANRPICSFVVSQNEMISIWTKATQQLAFFKEIFDH